MRVTKFKKQKQKTTTFRVSLRFTAKLSRNCTVPMSIAPHACIAFTYDCHMCLRPECHVYYSDASSPKVSPTAHARVPRSMVLTMHPPLVSHRGVPCSETFRSSPSVPPPAGQLLTLELSRSSAFSRTSRSRNRTVRSLSGLASVTGHVHLSSLHVCSWLDSHFFSARRFCGLDGPRFIHPSTY